ncbi:MAG: aminotransferase class I/II-fold pyridoxal phosphate-dependent enzyme [Proteobacteria bacterium]|nr:aminotransferase class I/II-fold pyridoxal phosphate-dependent enzyme [Pseudomonadota bacterium]
MYQAYKQHSIKLQEIGKYRSLSDTPSKIIDFSTNDYLGLSQRKELVEAASLAGSQYGVGSTGSRLLSGNKQIFNTLEKRIAQDKRTESALIFNSGFQANISVLASLLDSSVLSSRPLVFFNKFNHSSLYQAVFLSRAELLRYQHMNHLNDLLLKFQHNSRPKFIVTETLFGMDGNILPIDDLLELARKYKTFVYLDEAHATGVIGRRGYGLSTTVNFEDIPHLVMGTFSKALGCFGAYVACCNVLTHYLVNKAPGFIYSTSLSPMVIGAVLKAWDLVRSFDKERKDLFLKAVTLREVLKNLGFDISTSHSHIIPLILGKEERVIEAKKKLLKEGILVSSIRPPTVPPGTSRLRIALNTLHKTSDIEQLIQALKRL